MVNDLYAVRPRAIVQIGQKALAMLRMFLFEKVRASLECGGAIPLLVVQSCT